MTYAGGKLGSGVYQNIINLIPKHSVYVEAFLGGGSILRLKRPAQLSVGVEIDVSVVNTLWTEKPIPNLEIYNDDAIRFFASPYLLQFDANQTFIYLDPPYLMSVRSSKQRIYKKEFHTENEHRKLLKILVKMPQMIMISGYDSDLYNTILKGWRKEQFTGVSRGGARTETVWMNYAAPDQLHDYRYLGRDKRDRQNIKRQKQRWIGKLRAMPEQKRYAMLAAIDEFIRSTEGENTVEIFE